MKRKVLLSALLILAGIGGVLMPRMVESTIPTVYYITPSQKTHTDTVSASGTVQSGDVRQIYLQSSMVAAEVLVSVGDVVAQGDPLIRVDREKTTEAATLPLSVIRDVSGDITESQVNGIDWAAMASSYGLAATVSGGVSSPAIDTAVLEELLSGSLASARGGAMVDLPENGEITAPITGVVTEVDIQKEIPVAAGKSILTIADNQNYKVIAAVREEDIARVQLGDEANVRGVGFGGAAYTGRITKIYPTARKTFSGTVSETVVDVEIELDNPDNRLKPGFTAKVEILGGRDLDLVAVPYEAIKQDENNNEYVYLYEDGRLKKQVVTTGQELTNEVEILDGVTPDSVVVYKPSDAVREGAMIHIKGRADVD